MNIIKPIAVEEIKELTDQYIKWLRTKTSLRQVGREWIEITTPYLDRHNDYLQIFVRKQGENYLLTDAGYTITDLEMSGCDILNSNRRKELMNITLRGFGVHISDGHEDNAIEVEANQNNFAIKKHDLIQAILSVNDLFYTASPHVTNLFFEDIMQWFDHNDIRYSPNIRLAGKSGFDHMFDFIIPKSSKQPERIIQAINNPSKDNIKSLLFKWQDTQDTRDTATQCYALINNIEKKETSSLDALHKYNITPILWSCRDEHITQLAA